MRPDPQPTPTPVAPLPLPKGWRQTSLIFDGQRYAFIYNPRTRRVHAPGFPQLPLSSIKLHTGKIISQECLLFDSLLRKYVFFNVLPKYPGDFHRNSISNHL